MNSCWCTRGCPRLKPCLRHSLFLKHVPHSHTTINNQYKRAYNIAHTPREFNVFQVSIIECNMSISYINIYSVMHSKITSLPPLSSWFSSSVTGNKTTGAIAETSNVFSPLEPLTVPLEELTPRLPIVGRKLYGVPKLSLDSNLCFLATRFCFSVVLLTSRSARALDLVFISNHTEANRWFIALSSLS